MLRGLFSRVCKGRQDTPRSCNCVQSGEGRWPILYEGTAPIRSSGPTGAGRYPPRKSNQPPRPDPSFDPAISNEISCPANSVAGRRWRRSGPLDGLDFDRSFALREDAGFPREGVRSRGAEQAAVGGEPLHEYRLSSVDSSSSAGQVTPRECWSREILPPPALPVCRRLER